MRVLRGGGGGGGGGGAVAVAVALVAALIVVVLVDPVEVGVDEGIVGQEEERPRTLLRLRRGGAAHDAMRWMGTDVLCVGGGGLWFVGRYEMFFISGRGDYFCVARHFLFHIHRERACVASAGEREERSSLPQRDTWQRPPKINTT